MISIHNIAHKVHPTFYQYDVAHKGHVFLWFVHFIIKLFILASKSWYKAKIDMSLLDESRVKQNLLNNFL
jgi:hypothetical protein